MTRIYYEVKNYLSATKCPHKVKSSDEDRRRIRRVGGYGCRCCKYYLGSDASETNTINCKRKLKI